MLKTLLAGTAAATLLAFAAQAQDSPATTPEATAPEPAASDPTASETTPPRLVEDKMHQGEDPAADAPETAEDSLPPAEAPGTAEDTDALPPAETPETAADPAPATEPATEPATDTATDMAPVPSGALPEGAVALDLATVSPDTLIGADIRTYEGDSIAAVDDVMMSAEGKVDNVVARFGGFLGFGETKVLLAPDEMTVVRQADETVAVLTSLTADELKARPEYAAPDTVGPEG